MGSCCCLYSELQPQSSHINSMIVGSLDVVPGLLLPNCCMPRGHPSTTSEASAREPSQRRAAMLNRAAESTPSVPAP